MTSCDLWNNHSLMKLYKQKLETVGIQRRFLWYIDNKGLSGQFPGVNCYTVVKKRYSYRNQKFTKVFDTKSQHAWLYGVPQGFDALM